MPTESASAHDIQLVAPHPEAKIDPADVDKYMRGIYRCIGHFESLSDAYRFVAGEMAEQAAQIRLLRKKLYTMRGGIPHEVATSKKMLASDECNGLISTPKSRTVTVEVEHESEPKRFDLGV